MEPKEKLNADAVLVKASAEMILHHLLELGLGLGFYTVTLIIHWMYSIPERGHHLREVAFTITITINHSKEITDEGFLPAVHTAVVPKRVLDSTLQYPPQSISCTLGSSRILNSFFS